MASRREFRDVKCGLGLHTVDYDPFIKSKLPPRYEREGLMWCKFGHVPRRFWGCRDVLSPPETGDCSRKLNFDSDYSQVDRLDVECESVNLGRGK